MIVAPGVYDGFTARLALSVGFDALYMTGLYVERFLWLDLDKYTVECSFLTSDQWHIAFADRLA